MRTKWEEGVRRNVEHLRFARANFQTWEANDGWATDPEYMQQLLHQIKRQEQYLKNRFGEVLE